MDKKYEMIRLNIGDDGVDVQIHDGNTTEHRATYKIKRLIFSEDISRPPFSFNIPIKATLYHPKARSVGTFSVPFEWIRVVG